MVGELQPRKYVEFGALLGYSLIAALEGAPSIEEIAWADAETYVPGSNRLCAENLESYLRTTKRSVKFRYLNSVEALQALPRRNPVRLAFSKPDVLYVDGDHRFEAALRDMRFAQELRAKVVLVDDCLSDGDPHLRHAVADFSREVGHPYWVIPSYAGTAIFDFTDALGGTHPGVGESFKAAGLPVELKEISEDEIRRSLQMRGDLSPSHEGLILDSPFESAQSLYSEGGAAGIPESDGTPNTSTPSFTDVWRRVEHIAVVGSDRCETLFRIAQLVNEQHISGRCQDSSGTIAVNRFSGPCQEVRPTDITSRSEEIWECGVYRGGTALLLAEAAPFVPIRLFDTFCGMPPADPDKDLHREGDFGDTSLSEVSALFADHQNIHIHQGYIPVSFDGFDGVEDPTIAFVHIDLDIYASVRAALEWCYSRMSRDGVMVIDDYGAPSCPGTTEAIEGFFRDKTEVPIKLPTGPALIIMRTMREDFRKEIAKALNIGLQ